MTAFVFILLSLIAGLKFLQATIVCPDTRATHWFDTADDNIYQAGVPIGFEQLPASMTPYDLYGLQEYCVDQLNLFRQNKFPFSNGQQSAHDPSAYPQLEMLNTIDLQCHNERALSDIIRMKQPGGACGHYSFDLQDDCGTKSGLGAENACCGLTCDSVDSCKSVLMDCFQAMWDEGERVLQSYSIAFPPPSNILSPGELFSMAGHYVNMIEGGPYVTCGFGWSAGNEVLLTQDFYDNSTKTACQYSCDSSKTSTCGTCWTDQSSAGALPETEATTETPTTSTPPDPQTKTSQPSPTTDSEPASQVSPTPWGARATTPHTSTTTARAEAEAQDNTKAASATAAAAAGKVEEGSPYAQENTEGASPTSASNAQGCPNAQPNAEAAAPSVTTSASSACQNQQNEQASPSPRNKHSESSATTHTHQQTFTKRFGRRGRRHNR